MADNSNVINKRFRIDKNLKIQRMNYLKKLSMNNCVALNMFLIQIVRKHCIPFIPSLEIPNARLISAMEEVLAIESGKINAKKYKTFEEALEDID